MASGEMALADGIRLSWHEFGDSDGPPVSTRRGCRCRAWAEDAYDETAMAAQRDVPYVSVRYHSG